MFEFMVQHIFSGGLAGDIGAAQTGLGVTRHRDRDVLAEMIRDVRVRSRIRETDTACKRSPGCRDTISGYP